MKISRGDLQVRGDPNFRKRLRGEKRLRGNRHFKGGPENPLETIDYLYVCICSKIFISAFYQAFFIWMILFVRLYV